MSAVRANRVAAVAAGIALAVAIGFLRLRGLPVLIGAGVVYLGTLAMLWPKRRQQKTVLPSGIRKADFQSVESMLATSILALRDHATNGTHREALLFRKIADLVTRIRDHLHGNPAHLSIIQRFAKHGLARLIQMVTDYTDLKRRALPEHQMRLKSILTQMEAFIPALERIDKACIENDLDQLEISVEVMAEQIDRSRFT